MLKNSNKSFYPKLIVFEKKNMFVADVTNVKSQMRMAR